MGKMKKYAVIDIGTNSMRLLLAIITENHRDNTFGFVERKKYINTTRIGACVDKNKTISQEGIEKNAEAFYNFVQKAREFGVEEILAIATSAVREAKNKEEFIQAIYQKTGINIKIISGEEEAELGYRGVIMGLKCHVGTDSREGLRHSGAGSSCVMHPNDTKGPSPCVFLNGTREGSRFECHSETDRTSLADKESHCHPETNSRNNFRHSGAGSSCVMHPNDTKGPSPCVLPADILVIDIGGGSTELILGTRNGDVIKTVSLDMGAVRMTEKFITTDPIDKEEYEKMETAIRDMGTDQLSHKPPCHSETDRTSLTREESHCHSGHSGAGFSCVMNPNDTKEPSPCVPNDAREGSRFPTLTAVGIGGTITALAALHQKLDPYDPEKVHNYKLTLKDINSLKEKLLSLTVQQIKQLKGIHPKRADIIVAGITILSIIMDSLNFKEIIVSEYDNLEGMLYTSFF